MKKSVFTFLFLSFLIGYFLVQSNFVSMEEADSFLLYKIHESKKSARFDEPMEAARFLFEMRSYPLGYIPENWRSEALKHIEENNLIDNYKVTNLVWTQLGPTNIAGRVRSIIVDYANPSVLYTGSVSGGVWKSTNEGQSWFALKDNMENLAVASLVMDPTNNQIIYAGTGEGFFNIDAIRGNGIFKTTDAGATWSQLSSTNNSNFYYVNDLAIDKNNGRIYAATHTGLYYSTNGGTSWTLVSGGISGSNAYCLDIEISNSNPSTIFVSYGHFSQSKIFRSTDGGNSFVQIHTLANQGRAEIAIAPSNKDIIYISFHDLQTNEVTKFQKSTNGGASFVDITVPGPSLTYNSYTGPQAWYNNIIAVHPTDPNIVFAGGVDLFKTTNGGQTWTQITNWYSHISYPYVHADFHAIAFHPTNPNIIYVGTDGGIFRTSNGGLTWSERNSGLATIQFYYGAIHPNQNVYYGGTQDNGTLKSATGTNWSMVFGGDGGATHVDYNNPNIVYTEYVNLAIFKSTNAGSSWTKIMNGIPTGPDYYDGTTDRVLFIAPIEMDPNNPNILVAGTYRVFRTTNGGNQWSAISSDLTGDGTGSNGAKISALAIAKGNSNIIFAGCTNGRIQKTTDGGANWINISTGLPNLYLRDIEISTTNINNVYVTFSGFTSGSKVYKSTNGGASWTNISSNLPNIPVYCIALNPQNENHLLVGTDLGVFETTNGGTSWFKTSSSLPNVAVFDMDYRDSDKTLIVSTHGRGMWRATLTTNVETQSSTSIKDFYLFQNYPNPFNSKTKIVFQIPSNIENSKEVSIRIFDAQGRLVREYTKFYKSSGKYEIEFDGSGLNSGVYYCTLISDNFAQTRKMIYLK
ncbi:MAG: T9SS type A sorting domain-containing protein [Ignavibacteria bacterium]|nr:T9SS type A sorting domain-containing protein [Ignavibacteria bacterium]